MDALNRKERYKMMGEEKKYPPTNRCWAGDVPGMASVNKEKINTLTVLELLQTRAEYKPHFKNKECLQILPTSKNILGKLKDLPEKKQTFYEIFSKFSGTGYSLSIAVGVQVSTKPLHHLL